jgi:hypothetical protein
VAARPRPPRLPGLALGLGLLIALAACTTSPRDVHIPDFAKRPYEPFARAAAIAIAEREWRLFGSPVREAAADEDDDETGEKPERAEGLWQRVGEYWWLGLDADRLDHRWTGKHDADGRPFAAERDGRYAWSAAFISYVMRMAGAGDRFPYTEAHARYINAARRGESGLRAAPLDTYAPRPGDLICFGRGGDARLRFADLPAGRFASHCDLVTAVEPGGLAVIGGNVDDAVTRKHIPTGPDGTIADDRWPWFVAITIAYDR